MDTQTDQGKQQRCCKTGNTVPECTAEGHPEQDHLHTETASTENWFQPYLDACNEAKKYRTMYEEAIGALKAVCRLI